MQSLFADMPDPPIIHIDDLFCHSSGTFAKCLEMIDSILTCLETMQITAKKTSWGAWDVEFLWFLLGIDGYKPLPSQVQSIVNILPPKNVKQVH